MRENDEIKDLQDKEGWIMSALECPLCHAKFATPSDLASHLRTHAAEEQSPKREEVTITEVGKGLQEVIAAVVSVTKDCECDLCRRAMERARFKPRYPRWHITLRPDCEEYRDFHVWIAADSAYARDPRTAGSGTQLGDYVTRLKQLGMKGGIVDELFADMQGKRFLFERAKIGRKTRQTWVPKKLLLTISEEAAGRGGVNPVQACVRQMGTVLERGRAYTVRDAEAGGVNFPSDVIEEAFELLVENGRAFRLPTEPVKWFYEG